MPRMGRGHLEGRAIFFPELSGPTRWARSTYFSRAIEIRSSEVPDEGMTLSWLSETYRHHERLRYMQVVVSFREWPLRVGGLKVDVFQRDWLNHFSERGRFK